MSNDQEKDNSLVDKLTFFLAKRLKRGSRHQGEFEMIISDLAQLRLEKCEKYGESRYDETGRDFNLWMCFSDVHRKYIRLRQMTKILVKEKDPATVALLIDAYKDTANYSIMAVQVLTKQLEELNDGNSN